MTSPTAQGPRSKALPLAVITALIALGALWTARRGAEGGVHAYPHGDEGSAESPSGEGIVLPPSPPGAALGGLREAADPGVEAGPGESEAPELAALRVQVVDEFGSPWVNLRVDVGSHRHMTIDVGEDGELVSDLEEFIGQTDAAGIVQFQGLKPKPARVEVDDTDGKPWFQEVDLRPALTTELEFVIVRTKALTGRVLDSRGAPLVGAPVGLFKELSSYDLGQGSRHNMMFTDPRSSSTNQESGVLTDSEGRFGLRAPTEPGSHPYMLGAKYEGRIFSGVELPAPHADGTYPPVDIVLEDPVILRGTLRYADGSPGVGLNLIPLGGQAATQIVAWLGDRDVDSEGAFEIRTRPDVTHLSYGGPGGHFLEHSIGEVRAGQVLEHELTWTPPEGTAVIWFQDTAGAILEESSPLLENVELIADPGAGAAPTRWLLDSSPEVVEVPAGGQLRVSARRADSDISSQVFVEGGDVAHMIFDEDPASTERMLTLDIRTPDGVTAEDLEEALWGVRVQLGGPGGPLKSGLRGPNSRGSRIEVPLGRWPAGPLEVAWVGMTRADATHSVLGRTRLRIPDRGPLAPLDVDVLPCFHIDLGSCPEEFFYGNPDGTLELLDAQGAPLWSYRLGFDFSHGEVANFPMPPNGTARLRRGDAELELEGLVRSE